MSRIRQILWFACGLAAQTVAWLRHSFTVGYDEPFATGVIHILAATLIGLFSIALMLFNAPESIAGVFNSRGGIVGAVSAAASFFGKASLFAVLPMLTMVDLALGRSQPEVGVGVFFLFLPTIVSGWVSLVARLSSNDP